MLSIITANASRRSNMELLRIIAMMLVVIVHMCGAALELQSPKGDIASITSSDWWKLSVESISIIGVNIFVLISGYFGINTRWQTFWRFSLQCLFYSVGIYLVGWLIGIWQLDWNVILRSSHIYTESYYWFVPAYFGLLIIAPILNAAIRQLSQHQYLLLLIAAAIVTIYGGWWCRLPFSDRGYSTYNFAFLYLIARYIAIYIPSHSTPSLRLRLNYITAYLLFTIGIFVTSLYIDNAFHYNSPLVIGAALSLTLLFTTFSFQSVVINLIAASSFSIYLIHMHPLLWIRLKNAVKAAASAYGTPVFALWCVAVILIMLIACPLIDKIITILIRPLSDILTAASTRLTHPTPPSKTIRQTLPEELSLKNSKDNRCPQ